MADSKITALTALTAADPANDMIPIVDVSDTPPASGNTKRISINNILACSPSATLASATITGDLTVDTSTLKVDSANNRVYIGTTAAVLSEKFNVSSSSADTYALMQQGSGITALFGVNATGAYSGSYTNQPYLFLANNIEQYRISPLGVFTWTDGAGGTRMTLNSTGLGVGVSPSYNIHARGTTNGRIQVEGASGFGMVFIQGSSGNTAQLQLNSSGGTGRRFNLYSDPTGFFGISDETAVATRLTIDSSGNVGIGVTPSAWASYKALQVGSIGSLSSITGATIVGNNWFYDGASKYITTAASTIYEQGAGTHAWYSAASGTAGTAVSFGSAKMTLDASGNLLVGKTAASVTTIGFQTLANGEASVAMAASTSASSTLNVWSTGAAAFRFYVAMNGTISATNTTISAISDARLKENVQDIDVGLGAILALKPRKFDWKAGKGKDIKGDRGFIAQEFEQVFPNLIDEWKDPAPEGEAPYKSVRQDLIPVLVKAIQELTARVQTLETR